MVKDAEDDITKVHDEIEKIVDFSKMLPKKEEKKKE